MKSILYNCFIFVICCIPIPLEAQYVTITGFVTSDKNGNYLENVNIYESGSTIGTLTNKDGSYHLMIPPGKIDMIATFDGFRDFNMKMTVKKDTVLTIRLKPVSDSKSMAKKEGQVQAMEDSENHSQWRFFRLE